MASAIKTITGMVLISIDPFALRRLLLVLGALLGFTALCFADPVLMASRYGTSPSQVSATKTTPAAHVSAPAPLVLPLPTRSFCRWVTPGEHRLGWVSFLDSDYE